MARASETVLDSELEQQLAEDISTAFQHEFQRSDTARFRDSAAQYRLGHVIFSGQTQLGSVISAQACGVQQPDVARFRYFSGPTLSAEYGVYILPPRYASTGYGY